MFLRAELADKLNRVADYLIASIEKKEQTSLEKLEELIAAKTIEIDELKTQKRDLEIDVKKIDAENALKQTALEASWNREKTDINHLVALNREKDQQTAAHDKKMLELSFQEKAVALERDYNARLKALIEARDEENKKLLAAHMKDIKDMNAAILQRLPDVTAKFSTKNTNKK